jgi:membrane protein
MSWVMNIPLLARAVRSVQRRTDTVWTRDRAPLSGFSALGTRVARIVVLAGRGVLSHRIGLQAAALTYYTVFAIVPLLAVLLWTLKLSHHLPAISPELPANVTVPSGNELLHAALGRIFEAVDQTSQVTGGVLGLAALLFAVSKLFIFTERALHIIAASGRRTPSPWRALAYVGLLLVPPAVLAVSGVVLALMRKAYASSFSRLLPSVPGFELALGVVVTVGAVWLAVMLLYVAAARARLPFTSSAIGALLAAVALLVVFWVFATLQVGASKAGGLSSGFLAIPVFLLWVFSSWYTVLVGAEIVVAHHVDRVLVHGAAAFRLDCAGERQAGVAIMVRVAELSAGADEVEVPADELARRLRLPPHIIRDLCFRLADRGLLSRGANGFALACDPTRTTAAEVAKAIDRDPTLEGGRPRAHADGASLRDLAAPV